jgi:hypothetical protein
MKVWTKVEVSDLNIEFDDSEFEYKCTFEIEAWEIYDEECDIDHENWKRYNENYEVVATVYGIVINEKAEIRVKYEKGEYETNKLNLLIQKAVKEAMELVRLNLNHYFISDNEIY